MRFKRDHNRLALDLGCFCFHLFKDLLMSKMDPVEVPQSDDRVQERRLEMIDSHDNLHGSTLNGFGSMPIEKVPGPALGACYFSIGMERTGKIKEA